VKKLLTAGLAVLFLLTFAGLVLARYLGYFAQDTTKNNGPTVLNKIQESFNQPDDTSVAVPVKLAEIGYKVEPVVSNLAVPWSIAFTSPERMLITQRAGSVVVAQNQNQQNWQLLEEPLHTFPDVSSRSEEGLMGMVLDPDYVANKYLYFCYAYSQDGRLLDRVVRLTDLGSNLGEGKTIIENIPAAAFHAGCELDFGPDGKLFISTGDATDPDSAQDKSSLAGKILRLNPDGSIPEDNPFANSPVYSFGHRNPQGFDWHPISGSLYASEHGPSGSDGPGGGDEVNLIKQGQNYGWPEVSHERSQAGMVDPKLVFTPAIAPGSLVFYDHSQISGFRNNIFMAMLKGEGILRIVLDPTDDTKVSWYERIPEIEFGRIRDLAVGPDGSLYFSTSNRDGRGDPTDKDDQIFRIVASDEN
jgi:glucose/arabinose dehydrogenase